MDCREAERFADLSIDGEIEPSEQHELEGHLRACPGCRHAIGLRSWFEAQVRSKLRDQTEGVELPPGLRIRISARLREEARPSRVVPWGRFVPVGLILGTVILGSWTSASYRAFDPEEAVVRHTRNLPPEVTARGSGSEVERLFAKNLHYPVPVPRFDSKHPDVRLVGARLSSIQNRDAAYLMYDQRGARISLFAYPKEARFAKPEHFEERLVGGRPILVGRHRGYNVVAWEAGSMLYSLVSDVDHDELIQLAASPDQ